MGCGYFVSGSVFVTYRGIKMAPLTKVTTDSCGVPTTLYSTSKFPELNIFVN